MDSKKRRLIRKHVLVFRGQGKRKFTPVDLTEQLTHILKNSNDASAIELYEDKLFEVFTKPDASPPNEFKNTLDEHLDQLYTYNLDKSMQPLRKLFTKILGIKRRLNPL